MAGGNAPKDVLYSVLLGYSYGAGAWYVPTIFSLRLVDLFGATSILKLDVTGRPRTIHSGDSKPLLPLDAPVPRNCRETIPQPRTSYDKPTTLTFLLLTVDVMTPLGEIIALEREGAHPKDYSKVERLHAETMQRIERIPSHCRYDKPDTTFDSDPDCHWLPSLRSMLAASAWFVLLALHRPYIFSIAKSRGEALKAGLNILRAQEFLFRDLETHHYKMFHLIFSTFDAVVLVAAIYIMYPRENTQHLDDTVLHIEWALQRFERMSKYNRSAKSGLGVLQALQMRLKKALRASPRTIGQSNNLSSGMTPSLLESSIMSSLPRQSSSNHSYPSHLGTVPGNSTMDLPRGSGECQTHLPPPEVNYNNAAMYPISLDWAPVASTPVMNTAFEFGLSTPLRPLHDLVYNNLEGELLANRTQPTLPASNQMLFDANAAWQFGGDFQDDSFWNFMNHAQ